MLDKSAQPGRAPLKERRNDCYDTPIEAVLALMQVEDLPSSIWEPCAGKGNIVTTLRKAGHQVYATDLNERGCPLSESRIDFLLERKPPFPIGAVVTNPPFALAEPFIRHALTLCPKAIMLLRLAFLESERRSEILDGGYLARVHVFKRRLPMMHREGWTGNKAGNSMAFAWMVWDRSHTGPAELHRV
jgi:hypothetical protein